MIQDTQNDKKYEIIGVFSFLESCESLVPDVYVRVTEYMPWIERNLENFVDPHVVLTTFEDRGKPINIDEDIVIMIASGVIILGFILVGSLLVYLIHQTIQFSNERNCSLRNDDEINEVQLSDGENPSKECTSPLNQAPFQQSAMESSRGENDSKEFQLSDSDLQQIITQVLETLRSVERDQEIST